MKGDFTLVFETSTPHASLATIEADGRLLQREFTSDRSHNALLFAPLKELLDARVTRKIGLVLVGSGPGSYSGTRVGIAAAQGVAIAASCPAVAVPSILAVPSAGSGLGCVVIGDARRGSFWTTRVQSSIPLPEPVLTDLEGLETIVAGAIREGVPVISFEEPERFPLAPELSGQVRVEIPSAERLWQAWNLASSQTRERWAAESPQPMYLRPPHITPAKRPWLVQPAG